MAGIIDALKSVGNAMTSTDLEKSMIARAMAMEQENAQNQMAYTGQSPELQAAGVKYLLNPNKQAESEALATKLSDEALAMRKQNPMGFVGASGRPQEKQTSDLNKLMTNAPVTSKEQSFLKGEEAAGQAPLLAIEKAKKAPRAEGTKDTWAESSNKVLSALSKESGGMKFSMKGIQKDPTLKRQYAVKFAREVFKKEASALTPDEVRQINDYIAGQ